MSTQPYLVYSVDDIILCKNEAVALSEAEQIIQNNSIDEVAIFKRVKTGKRQAIVKWDEGPGVPRGTPQELSRPPYQGANKRWSNGEVTYLKQARRMGMSFEGIARKLGRTVHAVEVKYSRL